MLWLGAAVLKSKSCFFHLGHELQILTMTMVALLWWPAFKQQQLAPVWGVSVGYDAMEARKAPLGDSLIQLLELNIMQKPIVSKSCQWIHIYV